MLEKSKIFVVVVMIGLMLGPASLPGWADEGTDAARFNRFSGDDGYDPAADGHPEWSVVAESERFVLAPAGGFVGNGDYDPAIDGMPELSVVVESERSALTAAGGFSGDDEYDPAADGHPELSDYSVFTDASSPVDCDLFAAAIDRQNALSIDGGFGGDDGYDPAAGGIPELALFAYGALKACASSVLGN